MQLEINHPPISIEKDPNDVTLEAYNHNVDAYIQATPQGHPTYRNMMTEWIDAALDSIPAAGSVLELGSATPRDATYMRSRGYKVQCTDASIGFIDNLLRQGEDAQLLNALKDPIPKGYDMIFANGVIQHFTRADALLVLFKISQALKKGGIFAFSVKEGLGEKWVTEKFSDLRYMHYWQPEEIKLELEKCGFTLAFNRGNSPGDLPNHSWITIVARKK
jgi:SAM-dependent methyltransferase